MTLPELRRVMGDSSCNGRVTCGDEGPKVQPHAPIAKPAWAIVSQKYPTTAPPSASALFPEKRKEERTPHAEL